MDCSKRSKRSKSKKCNKRRWQDSVESKLCKRRKGVVRRENVASVAIVARNVASVTSVASVAGVVIVGRK